MGRAYASRRAAYPTARQSRAPARGRHELDSPRDRHE